MEFLKTDYLNADEIKKLITVDFSHDKSNLLCNKLDKYCFVFNNELYELQSNFTYQNVSNLKLAIINKVSLLIQKSYKKIGKTDRENIKLKYPKTYKKILKNSDIESYYPQLLLRLTKQNIVFNVTIGQIHYNNGYLDVNTKQFKQRNMNDKFYITKYITRDYKGSTEKQRNQLLSNIKKVYPNSNDLDCILYYLGSALSWKGTHDQCALFLLGLGSSGKSFILELTKAVLDCYFVELGSDTFAGTTSNINKVLNTYKSDSQILLSWVNEPVDKKMNSSLFKVWIDGNLQSTMLYKDGQFNFKHYSRCITTANTMPQIIIESGTTRRIVSYTHKSSFTEKKSEVDESKHIYLLDKDIINNIKEKQLLDAWFDILVDYCHKWLNGSKPEYGANFLETKDSIISNCDIFQDFIDSKLKFTTNEKDKIGKDEMKSIFLAMYPDKHLTTTQIITSLKEHKVLYNTNLRSTNNIRGCFYNIKFRDDIDDDPDDDPYEHGIVKTNQSIDTVSLKQYLDLEAKYKALLDKNNEKLEPEKDPFKVPKQFYFYDEDEKKPVIKKHTTTATKVKELFESF